MQAWRAKGVVNTETASGTMIGSTTGNAPGDGSITGIEEEIPTRAAPWCCRGTGDGTPNLPLRAQMRGSVCPPRRMGHPLGATWTGGRLPPAPGGGVPLTPKQLPQECALGMSGTFQGQK